MTTTSTIVGMFDDGTHARAAASDLAALGVSPSNITVTSGDAEKGYMAYQGAGDNTGSSIGRGIKDFFKRLFGTNVDDDDTSLYSEAVRRGTCVVTADVEESLIDEAANVLERHGAIDVDRLAVRYRSSGFESFDESAPIHTPDQTRNEWDEFRSQDNVALPVVEEQLEVGKRTVRRGGVRVHTRTTERPVDEVVTLREEHVRVERRPASRDATTQDLDGLQDRTIEVTETAEEPVVAKQARVVEEVVISKDVDQREERVRDTVRRTDVDVEDIDREDESRPSRTNGGRGASL